MKRVRLLFVLAAAFAAPALEAARSSAFGLDIFNTLVPFGETRTSVFSPISFELDCCVFAEACDPIKRANIAETLGVLTGFDGVYGPIRKAFAEAPATNRVSFLEARALCLPSVLLSYVEFRRRIWESCGASVCQDWPKKGAEHWLRAKMDGEMEDFEIPLARPDSHSYRYFDLVSALARLTGEKPVSEEPGRFTALDGTAGDVVFLRSRRVVDWLSTSDLRLMRLALDGGAYLYLLRPAPGRPFAFLRSLVTGAKLRDLLVSVESVTELDAGRGWCDVRVPKMDLTGKVDLDKGFVLARVPSSGFDFIDKTLTHRDACQRVRFRLEGPKAAPPAASGGKAAPVPARADMPLKDIGDATFDGPFVFIVYHPESDVVSIVGQYTGN